MKRWQLLAVVPLVTIVILLTTHSISTGAPRAAEEEHEACTGRGVERWAVTTGIHADAHPVNQNITVPTSIVTLRSPHHRDGHLHLPWTEQDGNRALHRDGPKLREARGQG